MSILHYDKLRAEQVAAVYGNAVEGTVGSLIAAAILSGMLVSLGAVPLSAAVIFVALVFGQSITRFVLIRAYRRSRPAPSDWQRWARRAIASALAGGLTWGFGSLLLMSPSRVELQFIVLLVCAGIAAGAITAFATYLPAYYCNLCSIMAPTTIWAASHHDVLHWTYAALATLWTAVIAMLAKKHSDILNKSLRLQFENLDLATNLRLQKEKAEEASVAKSRFLASASHDLRQPVHALSMFVGALRARKMDDDAQRLVKQIDDSVGALDGLFTSLLDISRLDAGVIQAQHQSFPILAVLKRICRDEGAEATRKNLTLTLIPCSQVVESDPVLLERILRNLISNAIRYTDKGRVVVGCRRGERLSVEVWDSGRGIAPDERDLIFQEFYQIGNPERDRSRGLGLGLAIVARLTDILKTPLTLQSLVGRGSVFKLSVPISQREPSVTMQEIDGSPGAANPLLILVIDDEVAIQASMQSLLTSWGHVVTVAGSCQDMLARIAECTVIPDLIISDYRLRSAENGIETIQRLRSEFNENIPAILMTGDTAPSRIREASESSCLLMHKPVSNGKLRAAITSLTIAGPRSGEPAW
jgi:signal transduction histidine kinase